MIKTKTSKCDRLVHLLVYRPRKKRKESVDNNMRSPWMLENSLVGYGAVECVSSPVLASKLTAAQLSTLVS